MESLARLKVTCEKNTGITHVIMNHPKNLNALDDEMIEALCYTMQQLNDDLNVKVIILSAEGPHFSAGGDVKAMHERTGMFGGSPAEIRHHYHTGIQRLPRMMYRLEVPVIAAIHGYAVGGGADLAAMCDIRIAAEDAIFSERFVKLGLISGDGGAWIWPRLLGVENAYRILLTGDWIKAEEAL